MKRDVWLRSVAMGISILCVVLFTLTLAVARTPSLRRSVSSTVEAWQYPKVSLDPKVLQGSDLTVLIYARGNCPVCQKHGQLFKDLVSAVRDLSRSMPRLVTPRTVDEEVVYAQELGLERQEIVVADLDTIRPVRLVPSVFVVDRTGKIVYRLSGADQLSKERISKLVATVRG